MTPPPTKKAKYHSWIWNTNLLRDAPEIFHDYDLASDDEDDVGSWKCSQDNSFCPESDDSSCPESDLEENITEEEQDQFLLKIRSPLFSSIDSLASTISELYVELVKSHEEENAEEILERDTINAIRDLLYGDTDSGDLNSKTDDSGTEFSCISVDPAPFCSNVASFGSNGNDLLNVAVIGSEVSNALSNRSGVTEVPEVRVYPAPFCSNVASFGSNGNDLLDVAVIGSEVSDVLSHRSGVPNVPEVRERFELPAESVPFQSPSGYRRVNRRSSSLFSPLYTKLPELLVEYIKERPNSILADDFLENFHRTIAKIRGKKYIPLTIVSEEKFSKCKSSRLQSRSVVSKDIPQTRILESPRILGSDFFQSLETESSAEINSTMYQTVVSKDFQHKHHSKSAHAHKRQVPKQLHPKRKENVINRNRTEIPKLSGENSIEKNRKKQKTKRLYERGKRERRKFFSYSTEITSSQTYQDDEEIYDYENVHLRRVRKRKLKDSPDELKRIKIYKLCSCRNHVCDENT